MSTPEAKKQAILQMIEALKKIVVDEAGSKPSEDPAHEAAEPAAMENAEQELDMELNPSGQEVGGEEEAGEPASLENAEKATGSELEEEGEYESPFGSDKERMMRNLYNGGKSKSRLAGSGSSSQPSPIKKGRFGK